MTKTIKAGPTPDQRNHDNRIFYILGLVLVAGFVFFAFSLFSKKDNQSTNDQTLNQCPFFTIEDAKKILGKEAKEGGSPPLVQASSDDIEVKACSYAQNISRESKTTTKSIKSASVTIRHPKNDTGKLFNEYQFGEGMPKDVTGVSGYGEKAYWDSRFGTLNLLKSGQWVIVSSGISQPIEKRKLDDAKKLADLVMSKL